jgi:hypothetical protein
VHEIPKRPALRVDEPSVVALAEEGRPPGQRIAGQWHFPRALIALLSGSPTGTEVDPHG